MLALGHLSPYLKSHRHEATMTVMGGPPLLPWVWPRLRGSCWLRGHQLFCPNDWSQALEATLPWALVCKPPRAALSGQSRHLGRGHRSSGPQQLL